jgi:hypothetical protein
MNYQIDSDFILIELDRTAIVDISIGDQLDAASLNAFHIWTDQDMQFVESNPDARIFIRFEKASDNSFKGKGLIVVPHEVY